MNIRLSSLDDISAIIAIEQATNETPWTKEQFISSMEVGNYSNVMELKNARNADSTVPLNNNQVKQFLREQEEKNMQIGSNVAFKLAKQTQESIKINNNISGHFNRILN